MVYEILLTGVHFDPRILPGRRQGEDQSIFNRGDPRMSRARRIAWIAAGGLLLALPNAAVPQPDARPEPALDPAALATLKRMSDYLTSLASMRFQSEVEYDAVQADGQRIEFGSTRQVTVHRPNRMRVDATDRNGARRSLFYDGRQVVLLDQAHDVYATAAQSGDVDAMLGYIEAQLGLPLPLGELLSAKLALEIQEGLVFAGVVGEETIDGVRCDHLALRNEDRGIQIWVEQGAKPLPRRVAITYEREPGQPQFRANLMKWDVKPRIQDSLFSFAPPKGAERIAFNSLAGLAPAGKEAR